MKKMNKWLEDTVMKKPIIQVYIIISLLIIGYSVSKYSSKESMLLEILFIVNAIILIVVITKLLKSFLSTKNLVIKSIVIVVIMLMVSSNYGILYYLSGDYSHNKLREELELYPNVRGDYFNLYDKGYNSDVISSVSFGDDDARLFVSPEILEYYSDSEKVFSPDLTLSWRGSLAYNNNNENIIPIIEEVYSGVNAIEVASAFNNGEYLYSVTSEEIDGVYEYSISKHRQDGEEIYIDELISSDEWVGDISIVDIDKDTEDVLLVLSMEKYPDGNFKIIKYNKELGAQDFLEIDIESKFDFSTFNIGVVNVTKIGDNINLTITAIAKQSETELGEVFNPVYSATINKDGDILNEYTYVPEKTLYDISTLNVAHYNNKIYVVSYVEDSKYVGRNSPSTDEYNNNIRIDQLTQELELERMIFVKEDNLGDFSINFKIEGDGDNYAIYSNSSIIEFKVIEKNRLRILRVNVTVFASLFVFLGLISWLRKK